MKRKIFLSVFILFIVSMSVFSHEIIAGHSYEYEWKIINFATGDVISSGSGAVVPETDRGYRNIEHYIRSKVLGWNSKTRTVNGVRQRIIINLAGEEACD